MQFTVKKMIKNEIRIIKIFFVSVKMLIMSKNILNEDLSSIETLLKAILAELSENKATTERVRDELNLFKTNSESWKPTRRDITCGIAVMSKNILNEDLSSIEALLKAILAELSENKATTERVRDELNLLKTNSESWKPTRIDITCGIASVLISFVIAALFLAFHR